VPPPQLAQHHPALVPLAGGDNYYDPDDVIGYALRPLNAAYAQAVARDAAINVGSLLTSWNPLSHMGHWTDDDVTTPIAAKLAALWRARS
jgi:hypothetical protein